VRGKFDDGLNLPQQIDFQYLPGHKWDGAYDPEGILSTIPAVGTCLLGVFAGLLLKNGKMPDQRKVLYLLAAGLGGVNLAVAKMVYSLCLDWHESDYDLPGISSDQFRRLRETGCRRARKGNARRVGRFGNGSGCRCFEFRVGAIFVSKKGFSAALAVLLYAICHREN
jgi:hypothetical protein